MPETAVDLSAFFSTAELTPETYEQYADQAFVSPGARAQFDTLVGEYRKSVDAGRGEPLRAALAMLILGRLSDAVAYFEKAGSSRMKHYFLAQAEIGLGKYRDAIDDLKSAVAKGWEGDNIELLMAGVLVRAGDHDAAEKILSKHQRTGQENAGWHFTHGLLQESADDWGQAVDAYEKALALDPDHAEAMFRLARLYDLRGEDDQAIELYQRLAFQPRAYVNALINLAVLYEDREKYEEAAECLERVLSAYPNHTRARLFLKDVESCLSMIVSDAGDEPPDPRRRLLETPITEFELSVRSRNCLKKMKIMTLGDLIKRSEAELMAYKNFGDQSLNEIRELLAKKGLRLGVPPEEIEVVALPEPPPPAPKPTVPPGREGILTKSVSELELSVRARRCLQRLSIQTIGELISKTETDLLQARNFGVTSLNEIKAKLTDLGLSLLPKHDS